MNKKFQGQLQGQFQGQLQGQITVFASLVIVLVLSVVCASIRSVSMSVAKTNANIACNLSIESVFAEYSKPLLEEFDLLFFKKTDQLEYKLKNYIEELNGTPPLKWEGFRELTEK